MPKETSGPVVPESEQLSGEHLQRMVATWNDTVVDFPVACAHELVAMRAAEQPNAVAVQAGTTMLSYGQLDADADQLAAELVNRGVGPEALVGVCVERGSAMVIALLAIWKAGAAYLPLDPEHPAERIAYMLDDAGASLVVTQSALVPRLGSARAAILLVDERGRAQAAAPGALPAPSSSSGREPAPPGPDWLAYVIYTSGSTGRPKGVMITHRALVNFLFAMAREPGLSCTDVVVALTTLSFDIAGLELWGPLSTGGRVVVASRTEASDPSALGALIDTAGASVVQATPATWRMLVDAGWKGRPGLRILCGGEALPRALAERLHDLGDGVWNLYGPTEATIWATVARLVPGEPVTLGRPIANMTAFVLDDRMALVPPEAEGELHLGGVGLARGYLGRPDLTAERFVPNPFVPGELLYKTGDLARWLPDGTLEYLGRLDHQVKLRGYRIELGEIEAVLDSHAQVHEVVVVAREDTPGDHRLVAYLVAAGEAPAPGDLRRFVSDHLPSYMVPSSFVFLDALPLTPNNKVDRKALPAPDSRQDIDVEFVAPRTQIEADMVAVWETVLGVEPVGMRDDFFALGGHSLLATQLVALAGERLGATVPLAALFERPTVEALAAFLTSASRPMGGEPMPPLVRLDRSTFLR